MEVKTMILEHKISFKATDDKCFRDNLAGLDEFKLINIIIGRNNSGKSAFLDILLHDLGSKKSEYQDVILEEDLNKFIGKDRQGNYSTVEIAKVREAILGQPFKGVCNSSGITNHFVSSEDIQAILDEKGIGASREYSICLDVFEKVNFNRKISIFNKKAIRKVAAERNIIPEQPEDLSKSVGVHNDGKNATLAITHHYSFKGGKVSYLKDILNGLNEIFNPDCRFNNIKSKAIDKTTWEVCFEEENKDGDIYLSQSGSGIKTVLHVLISLHIGVSEPGNAVFLYEELENNLHPHVVRNLFRYIAKYAKEHKSVFFITTHSSIPIDMFRDDLDAQIIHVTHDGCQAKAETISTLSKYSDIIDDIGVKASDLLQANGIVWLEGPSDRIYFNKWIELYSNGELKEHIDYECAFYGGSNLASHKAGADEDNDSIDILNVNRNAVLIGDSDRKSEEDTIKPRLARIEKQIDKNGKYIWILDAKEIENYIPYECVKTLAQKGSPSPIGKYEIMFTDDGYLNKFDIKYSYDKVRLAKEVVKIITDKALLEPIFDLDKKMKEICLEIQKWNNR